MIKHVAIIEDNKDLVEFITEFLTTSGDFSITSYTSGVQGLNKLKLQQPDLVLIDLQLEDLRGDTICSELRKLYPELPLIILTGDKSQESIVHCLNAGADDYITKPFNADEFLARINARLRHKATHSQRELIAQDLVVNLDTLEVRRDKQKIELTAKEFELLKYLLTNKFRVLTRDLILNAVWGYTTEVDTRVVDVHIGKLRKKLESPGQKKLIESVRGFGYRILD